jgi:hypothetical protein
VSAGRSVRGDTPDLLAVSDPLQGSGVLPERAVEALAGLAPLCLKSPELPLSVLPLLGEHMAGRQTQSPSGCSETFQWTVLWVLISIRRSTQ